MSAIEIYEALKRTGALAHNDPADVQALREICELEKEDNRQRLQEAYECAQQGRWDEACSIVASHGDIIEDVIKLFFKDAPDRYQRKLILGSYVNNGWKKTVVRDEVKKLSCKGLVELPKEYADKEEITVYRGGDEPLEEAKNRLSWTLSKEVAIFFLERKFYLHQAPNLYRAKIFPKDVISYREPEQEVIQYQKVFEVEALQISPALWSKIKDDLNSLTQY